MAMGNMSIKEWRENFLSGKFDSKSLNTQVAAGWYDWFCSDNALAGKTRRLGALMLRVCQSEKIDCEKSYAFFKNCCPAIGVLYDQFSICDIETGDVQYCVVPKSGHDCNRGESEVWGKENDFACPLVEGAWKDVLNFFGV